MITVDPRETVKVLESHGRLKYFETGEPVVEVESRHELEALEQELQAHFNDQCNVEPILGDK